MSFQIEGSTPVIGKLFKMEEQLNITRSLVQSFSQLFNFAVVANAATQHICGEHFHVPVKFSMDTNI
jgi:hypothetical protein